MNTLQIPNEIFIPQIASYLRAGHDVTINVKGLSMRPFIDQHRHKVFLQPCHHYRVGDIVLAETDSGHYVLHRIISLSDQEVILQGDGNCRGTEHCTPAGLLGRCKLIIRKRDGKTGDPYTPLQCRLALVWRHLMPIRRYLLAIYNLIYYGHLHSSHIKYED